MSGLKITGVYETVLYAHDLAAMSAFYCDVLGLDERSRPNALARRFRLPSGAMLLIFDPRQSAQDGRDVPSHGAEGAGHIAFSVDDLDAWQHALEDKRIAIEHSETWTPGGRSIYVRDPAGNSVELVEGEVWA